MNPCEFFQRILPCPVEFCTVDLLSIAGKLAARSNLLVPIFSSDNGLQLVRSVLKTRRPSGNLEDLAPVGGVAALRCIRVSLLGKVGDAGWQVACQECHPTLWVSLASGYRIALL